MQEHHQKEQWHVDRRQIVGKPPRQEDVRNRASLRPKLLGEIGEWTPKTIRSKDETLSADHDGGDGRSPV
jgi:hypothetical protein